MVTFQKLWENHPTITDNDNPCKTNGKSNYPNQCAIRVGASLAKRGVNISRIPEALHCWHKHDKSLGHIIRAEELANGLNRHIIPRLQKAVKGSPDDFAKKLSGKRGIIFFKDDDQRTNNGKKESVRNRSGDHIDLWNGSRLTNWFTWVKIQAEFSWEGSFSDFGKSKEVSFWRVL